MISNFIRSKPHPQRPSFLQLLTGLAVLGFSVSLQATPIPDGGFEAAGGGNVYFAGQSIDTGSWTVTAGSVYIDSGDPYVFDGNNSLNLTYVNPYTLNSVSQVLSTVAGGKYLINFWANADTANTFSLLDNGLAVSGAPGSIVNNGFPGAVSNSSLFVDYTGVFVATSASTTLTFASTGNPPIGSQVGSVLIDDVSLTLTPEPASIAFMLTGVIGVGIVAVRRRLAGTLLSKQL